MVFEVLGLRSLLHGDSALPPTAAFAVWILFGWAQFKELLSDLQYRKAIGKQRKHNEQMAAFLPFLSGRPDLSVRLRYRYLGETIESVLPPGTPFRSYLGEQSLVRGADLFHGFGGRLV